MKSKSNTILYLAADKFQFYNNIPARIVDFNLGERFVQNDQLITNEDLRDNLQSFLNKEKIEAGNMIIVISETARYAAKPESYNAIKEMFENSGFKVEFIMPDYVYGNVHNELTIEYAAKIFEETMKYQVNNLLTTQIPAFKRPEAPKEDIADKFMREQRKKDIMRLYAYTSIFGMLIVAIIAIWYINPLPQFIQGKAFLERYFLIPETSKLSVRVINCTDSKEVAKGINVSMGMFVFRDVEVLHPENISECPAQRNTVMFSKQVSAEARGAILYEVMKYSGNILIADKDNSAPEVEIIIKK